MDRLDPRTHYEKLKDAYDLIMKEKIDELLRDHLALSVHNFKEGGPLIFLGGKNISYPIVFDEADCPSGRDKSNKEFED